MSIRIHCSVNYAEAELSVVEFVHYYVLRQIILEKS